MLASAPDRAAAGPVTTRRDTADASGAERRHLTVMFCDLVGSTDLASRLDPEDMADIIRAYQDAATAIIRRFDGYVAKYMGDGILVYFGFPVALEKDAARAIRTGLAIIEALPGLNAELGRAKGAHLAVRIGIATGLVMVGETVGTGAGAEKTVVGEAPNLAARLQGLAGPDGIVVSTTTRDLAGDEFAFADFGVHDLKGIPEPVSAWRVTGLIAERDADPDAEHAAAPLLVGRDEEIGLLRRAWQQTWQEGRGQVVLVSGEPGIGKTTLMRSLQQDIERRSQLRVTLRCSPYHTNSTLYPMIEHLKRSSLWEADDDPSARIDKLERMVARYSLPREEAVPLLAALLSLAVPEDRYPALGMTPQQLKQQTADAMVALVLEESERQPSLMVWEDVHWADPSTLEFIGLIIDQAPTVPLLIVLTYRPEFVPPWTKRSHLTPITLGRLERPQIEAMATNLAGGKELPREVLDYIATKTDGVPLYVEELGKTVLGSGLLKEDGERYVSTGPLSGLAIPASLQEVLMARLDRLPTAREVAQLGSVLGRQFAYEMVQAISAVEDIKLKDGLGQLVGEELLYQRGRPPRATYTFKHALIQDAAYQSLLKRTRQHVHDQVARLLESRYPEVVEAQPELLAHHYAESGGTRQAIAYLLKAAQKALRRSANHEVIAHANRAIGLLTEVPESPDRATTELALQRSLGNALMATKGYAAAETGLAFERALQLCQVADENQDIGAVLTGIYLFKLTSADYVAARAVAREILAPTGRVADPETLIVGHGFTAISDLHTGAPVHAEEDFDRTIDLIKTHRPTTMSYRYGFDMVVATLAYSAWGEWLLGRPDTSRARAEQALAAFSGEKHLYSMSRSQYWTAVPHQMRGEWSIVRERGRLARKLGKEHGFAMVAAAGRILEGAARAALGDPEAGIAAMRHGLDAYAATGARFQRPYHLVLLAEALLRAGHVDEAFGALAAAETLIGEAGERFYEAEVHRVRG
ncbi:MAG: AAA family ATPase, partial [Gemmatimonadales bacterium]